MCVYSSNMQIICHSHDLGWAGLCVAVAACATGHQEIGLPEPMAHSHLPRVSAARSHLQQKLAAPFLLLGLPEPVAHSHLPRVPAAPTSSRSLQLPPSFCGSGSVPPGSLGCRWLPSTQCGFQQQGAVPACSCGSSGWPIAHDIVRWATSDYILEIGINVKLLE